ncbi:MAG: HDIG domain-containing protein [Rhodothermales bacterium]|nr:HDIG domain-containing protein [Rhodothermales bacterium]
MGILDNFRFSKRKSRPVGGKLEFGLGNSDVYRRRNLTVKTGLILFLVAATMLAFPGGEFSSDAEVGEIWNSPTLIAPYAFSIIKDPAQLTREREEVKYQVAPLFAEVDAKEQTAINRDTVAEQFDRILQAYESYSINSRRGLTEQATTDSISFVSLKNIARVKLSPAHWNVIINDFASRSPGLTSATRTELRGPGLDDIILEDVYEQALVITDFGAIDLPLDSIYTDHIVVRSESDNFEVQRQKSQVFGLNEAYSMADEAFDDLYPDNPDHANIASAFFRAIFQPSLTYLANQTQRQLQEKRDKIPRNEGAVERGDVIVQQGDLITEETLRKISSLERQQTLRKGERIGWKVITGRLILTIAIFFFFFMYLYVLRRKIFDDNAMIFLMTIVFGSVIGLFALVVRMDFATLFVVPVAIASVILTVIYDSRVALFATVTLALLGGLLISFDYEYTFATVIAGALGIYSVKDIKNRSQFFVSAGLVFVGYVLVLVALLLMQGTSTDIFVKHVIQSGLNSFLIIMAFPLLWVFEKAFDITTDLTLLELSDTNRPLLKELSIHAPGTFNHTLQVANLAEAAADAIGANALLTRVGALYHDIGKMHKPEYFVENQHPGNNPHDNLKPRMSALIITSHVKEGIEIAREYNLPKLVEDFIPMHHGTSLVEYFYRRAREKADDSETLSEAEFRYPGPRPNSKESGILMLADSVEAAGRTIESPTHKRFENLIDSLFASRINDDQLALTNLNFRELNTIKETFLNMLVSMYHVRVKYPGQEEEEAARELAEKRKETVPDPEVGEPVPVEPIESNGKPQESPEG